MQLKIAVIAQLCLAGSALAMPADQREHHAQFVQGEWNELTLASIRFKVKRPGSWYIARPIENQVQLQNVQRLSDEESEESIRKEAFFNISVRRNVIGKDMPIQAWLEQMLKNAEPATSQGIERIAGQDSAWAEITESIGPVRHYFIARSPHVIEIAFPVSEKTQAVFQPVYRRILKSFTFLPGENY